MFWVGKVMVIEKENQSEKRNGRKEERQKGKKNERKEGRDKERKKERKEERKKKSGKNDFQKSFDDPKRIALLTITARFQVLIIIRLWVKSDHNILCTVQSCI